MVPEKSVDSPGGVEVTINPALGSQTSSVFEQTKNPGPSAKIDGGINTGLRRSREEEKEGGRKVK
jgi:hypothetical protein